MQMNQALVSQRRLKFITFPSAIIKIQKTMQKQTSKQHKMMMQCQYPSSAQIYSCSLRIVLTVV